MEICKDSYRIDKDYVVSTIERACASSSYTFIMNNSGKYDAQTQLVDAGLDPEELEFMDYEERKAVLEAAGLNPRDFDF